MLKAPKPPPITNINPMTDDIHVPLVLLTIYHTFLIPWDPVRPWWHQAIQNRSLLLTCSFLPSCLSYLLTCFTQAFFFSALCNPHAYILLSLCCMPDSSKHFVPYFRTLDSSTNAIPKKVSLDNFPTTSCMLSSTCMRHRSTDLCFFLCIHDNLSTCCWKPNKHKCLWCP